MKTKKTRADVTISMPQDMAEEYDRLAKRRYFHPPPYVDFTPCALRSATSALRFSDVLDIERQMYQLKTLILNKEINHEIHSNPAVHCFCG